MPTGVPPLVLLLEFLNHWYDRVPPSVIDAVTDNAVGVPSSVYVAPTGHVGFGVSTSHNTVIAAVLLVAEAVLLPGELLLVLVIIT